MKNMIKKSIFTAASLLMMASQPAVLSEGETATVGAKIYNENCARCHNPRAVQEFSEEEWSVMVPHMRERAHLTGSESRALENFIAITFTAEKAQGKLPDMAHHSAAELISKFSCTGCHQLNNEGGSIGPSLDAIGERRNKEYIVQKLLNPAFDNRASAMPKFPLAAKDAGRIADLLLGK